MSQAARVPVDSLTQGLLGGVAAQALCGRALPRSAWCIGLCAGALADLDLFIRFESAPLGGLTYHRHFTHALAFIPVGASLAALAFLPWRAFAGRRLAVWLAALVAYATHGLLDVCTSYGTLWLWPFTDVRLAWDFIAIIDPLFSVILLAGLVGSVLVRRRRVALIALTLGVLYLGLGAVQHQRAMAAQCALAQLRDQHIERGRVMPTLMNLVLWRSVYEAEGRLHADAVRVPLFGPPEVKLGGSVPRITREALTASGPMAPAVGRAFERFCWFADGYTAWHPDEPRVVGDLRYSWRPESCASLWGLRLPTPGGTGRARVVHLGRSTRDGRRELWNALLGRDPRFRPLTTLTTSEE